MKRCLSQVWRTTAILLIACGGESSKRVVLDAGEAEPDASEAEPDAGERTPCEARTIDACEGDGCMVARATRVIAGREGPCLGDESITECRTMDDDCHDGDAETFSCDDEGDVWVSPQTCVPQNLVLCHREREGPLVACDEDYPVCTEPDAPAPGGCVRAPALLAPENDPDSGRLSLTGEIVEIGTGSSDALCGSGYRVDMIDFERDDAPNDAVPYLRLRDENGVEALLVLWNDSFPEVGVGQRLQLAVSYWLREFDPASAGLTVRSESGALIAWFSKDSRIASLDPPPEVQLSQGEAACVVYDGCVPRSENYAMQFSVAGTEQTLAPGERAQVGDFTAFHGGALAGDPDPDCADATGHFASAAVFRRTIP